MFMLFDVGMEKEKEGYGTIGGKEELINVRIVEE